MPRTSVVARVTLPNFLLASAALLASACQADISGTPRSASPAGGSGTAGTSSSALV